MSASRQQLACASSQATAQRSWNPAAAAQSPRRSSLPVAWRYISAAMPALPSASSDCTALAYNPLAACG